jgi:fused signal recognition particle receptor
MTLVAVIAVVAVLVAVIALFLGRPRALPAPEKKEELPTPKVEKVSERPVEQLPETTQGAVSKSVSPASVQDVAPTETSGGAVIPSRSEPESPPKPADVAPEIERSLTRAPPVPAPKLSEDKPRDTAALRKGLTQTRTGWMQKLLAVFKGRKEIDPALLDDIEETLLTGDVGAPTTKRFIDGLKQRLDRKELADADKVWDALKADALTILDVGATPFGSRATKRPFVILMVGVNGAGKTTTIAKLATRYKDDGKKVLLAAGDTFRAAAVAQLEMWAKRVGVDLHKGKETSKPGAVIYEAVARGTAEDYDVVIADTAGRLQTKAPLMEELRKIREAAGKALPGAPHEVLLVLDATTGQNAISQAREFRDTLELTGVVLTKLDGTARGGVILAVADEFKLPVRFVGVGEKSEDLREFDARDFVEALFAREGES